MAEKILKAKKRKVAPKKASGVADGSSGATGRAGSSCPPQQIVLVGTYKERQLKWIKENGVYNYPVKDGDAFDAAAFGKIKELWLYADAKGRRYCFTAEFIGKMSRDEFLAAHPTYANLDRGQSPSAPQGRAASTKPPSSQKGKDCAESEPHKEYYVFKTSFLDYGPKLENPFVLIRAMDFATGRGRVRLVKKAFDQFKADGELAPLAAYLPSEISQVPRERLRVCEAAVQLNFFQLMFPGCTFPATAAIVYVDGAIRRHPRAEVLAPPTENGKPFRLGEFFCGPGGLACGAMSANIENPNFKIVHAWSNDYDQETCNTYAENICREHPETVICHDVRKLRLDDPRLTPIDGFAFGFPCMKDAA